MIERVTLPDLFPPPGYAHVAVAAGQRIVTTAGAVPLDADGQLVGPNDLAAQTRQTIDNLIVALAAVGATGDNVLKTTVYVVTTDRADFSVAWREVQASPIAAAASTLLGVSLLGYEGQLVEIEAIAAAP